VLLAESVSVPALVLLRLPLPEIIPPIVSVVPESTSNVPPLNVRPPPLAPSTPSLLIDSVPADSVHGVTALVVPVSVQVPGPVF
jgi:hypothetical protein